MKTFSLKSPEIRFRKDRDNNLVFATLEIDSLYMYTNQLGITYPIPLSLFGVYDQLQRADLRIPENLQKVVELIGHVQSTMGICSRLSQILMEKLVAVNRKLKVTESYREYEKKELTKKSLRPWNFDKLDFMGHRNLFSAVLKGKKVPIENYQELIDKYELSSLTKALNNFILDRNKFTHGVLMYWKSEKRTVIKHLENNTEVYSVVNQDNFESFINAYSDFMEFLDNFNQHIPIDFKWERIKDLVINDIDNKDLKQPDRRKRELQNIDNYLDRRNVYAKHYYIKAHTVENFISEYSSSKPNGKLNGAEKTVIKSIYKHLVCDKPND